MNNAPYSSAPRSSHAVTVVAALGLGTALALALAIATRWVPALAWAAVAVALVAGFVAVWAARADFAAWRERAQADASAERTSQREHTRALHATQREVLAAVDARVAALNASLGATKVSLGRAQQQVSRLRGDNESLRVEIGGLRTENQTLRTENTELRTENDGLRVRLASEAGEGAEVLTLPRRHAGAEPGEWDGLDEPTVVNLDLVRLTSPLVAEVRARHAN